MLDLDDITIKLKYKLHVGYWIKLPGYGKPYQIVCDEELLWFGDKIPENWVIDLYPECIQPLQAFRVDELILSQQLESQDLLYSDDEDNRAAADTEVNRAAAAAEGDEEMIEEDVERAKSQRKNKGKYIAEEEEEAKEVEEEAEANKGDELVEFDYNQEVEDITTKTCVDPTTDWEYLQLSDLPRGSGYDNDSGSADLGSLDGSNGEEDAEGLVKKFIKRRYHEFNPKHDLQDPVFRLGMEFSNVDVFRKAIRAHFMKHRRVVKFKKNNPNRIRVVCKDEGCKWFVFASWLSDHKTFKIKSLLDDHTCVMSFKNKYVSSKLIVEKYVGQWRANPDWNFARMAERLRTDSNVDALKWQYYRDRSAAREIIQGSIKEQYSKLWKYGVEIRRMNPDSLSIMKCSTAAGDAKPRFQRLYICLDALKKGWKEGCMPILGLDGCFIKGHHTGQLLTAIRVNQNNQMYLIAYALVESECRETWLWFLELLGVDLEINNSYGLVWITDKQKGLIDAIREVFPHSEHWFTHYMERLRIESEACKWLADKDPLHWSRAFFKDTALCDMLCNNMCEAFNSVILQACDKPVITLMEMIRVYLMKRLVTKRAAVQKWHHQIGSKVMKFVERIKMESSVCNPEYSGNYVYQVKENRGEQFVVNIEQKSFACNKWQLIGILCIHGMAALLSSNHDPLDFIDNKYKKESFLKAYTPVIYGINGPRIWPKTNDIPVECLDFKK
ncbi:hypothetical protein Q3G72_003222 [Acer saccharum]|nr:hypothetical protein Q3G72_003222 [Acer saccharum]